jgi:hypothetical protein
LEEALPTARVALVGLAGEFFTVEPTYIAGMKREKAVVIVLEWHVGNRLRGFEWFETFDAESTSAVEM